MTIVVTGPESSGKTTLTVDLAKYFEIDFVDEYARKYLLPKNGIYDYYDLVEIARGQHNTVIGATNNLGLSLMDTDLLTIKIWSEYKFSKCDQWIIETLDNNKPDLYLLCKPDIPWIYDRLRENPNDREELYQIYLREIIKLDVPYVEISGIKEQRLSQAIMAVQELINQV